MTKVAEVMLVGTFHYPDKFDIFSEDVQKQIEKFTNMLEMVKPTKIAVEFPARQQNKLNELYEKSTMDSISSKKLYGNVERYGEMGAFDSGNEIVQIGFRLGKKLSHKKIYGIDEDIELSDELFEKITPSLNMNRYYEQMEKLVENVDSIQDMYDIHNSEEYNSIDHKMYIDMNKVNLGNYEGSQLLLQWYERNLKIYSNLQNISEQGDKVLVLIGSSHLSILKELINASSEMEILEWRRDEKILNSGLGGR